MNSILTMIVLSASVILEVILELKGVKVPDVVLLLSGFAVRHMIGGDTVKDAPTANLAQIIPIVEANKTTEVQNVVH